MLKDLLIAKGLSDREAEVAEAVTKGWSNREVGNCLFVTEKTIKFHLTNIYKKMGFKSRTQLLVWCAPHMSMVEHRQRDIVESTSGWQPPEPKEADEDTLPMGELAIPKTSI